MTQPYIPDITFVLGPPTDPELLAAHEKAQGWSDPGLDFEQFCLRLEPRLSSLLAEKDGEPSILSKLVSIVLDAPVRVANVGVGFTFEEGRYSANFHLRGNLVEGPAHAVVRLFERREPAQHLAECLAHVLELAWVHSLRSLPAEAEEVQ